VEKRDFALVIPAENDGFHLVEEYRPDRAAHLVVPCRAAGRPGKRASLASWLRLELACRRPG
jgi:hypothetical protein